MHFSKTEKSKSQGFLNNDYLTLTEADFKVQRGEKTTHWEEWSWPSLGFWHGPSGETQGLYVEGECCYSSALSCHFGQSNIP